MRKEKKEEKNDIKKERKEKRKRMRKELGLKRRERAVEGGNIKKTEKKRIRACSIVLCLLYCLLYKFHQAVFTPPQLLQSWGQLCPGRGRCDENASLPLI